jgi:hypothetical protein
MIVSDSSGVLLFAADVVAGPGRGSWQSHYQKGALVRHGVGDDVDEHRVAHRHGEKVEVGSVVAFVLPAVAQHRSLHLPPRRSDPLAPHDQPSHPRSHAAGRGQSADSTATRSRIINDMADSRGLEKSIASCHVAAGLRKPFAQQPRSTLPLKRSSSSRGTESGVRACSESSLGWHCHHFGRAFRFHGKPASRVGRFDKLAVFSVCGLRRRNGDDRPARLDFAGPGFGLLGLA